MSCSLTRGFDAPCNDTIAGTKAIYFGKWSELYGIATFDATSKLLDTLPAITLYKYEPHRNTGFWNEEPDTNDNGSIFYKNTIGLSLKGLSVGKQVELQSLLAGRWVAFVQDNQDQIWVVGYWEGLTGMGGSANATTGVAKGDLNGYTITLYGEDKNRCTACEDFTSVPFDNFPSVTIED
jgi:hypothetical protein